MLDTVLVQERGGDRRKMVEKFVSLFLTGTRHEVKDYRISYEGEIECVYLI